MLNFLLKGKSRSSTVKKISLEVEKWAENGPKLSK